MSKDNSNTSTGREKEDNPVTKLPDDVLDAIIADAIRTNPKLLEVVKATLGDHAPTITVQTTKH